jgi:hypothetical protein
MVYVVVDFKHHHFHNNGLVSLPTALPQRRAFIGIGYSSLMDPTSEYTLR